MHVSQPHLKTGTCSDHTTFGHSGYTLANNSAKDFTHTDLMAAPFTLLSGIKRLDTKASIRLGSTCSVYDFLVVVAITLHILVPERLKELQARSLLNLFASTPGGRGRGTGSFALERDFSINNCNKLYY